MTISDMVRSGFNRVEVIDHRREGRRIVDPTAGRALQAYGRNIAAMISVQDDGMTLKLFLSDVSDD